MSTRSTTHFCYGDETQAIIYRHPDGYPEGHGRDLQRFFADVEAQTADTRYTDPSYLAAKLVVWLAGEFAVNYVSEAEAERQGIVKEWEEAPVAWGDTRAMPGQPLDFLSVGVMKQDPGDIEYRYKVHCDRKDAAGRPEVECYAVPFDARPDQGELVEIPA